MTITIHVSEDVSSERFACVKALARDLEQHDVNFSGASIDVVRDDDYNTWVYDSNWIRGVQLLAQVEHQINGADREISGQYPE